MDALAAAMPAMAILATFLLAIDDIAITGFYMICRDSLDEISLMRDFSP